MVVTESATQAAIKRNRSMNGDKCDAMQSTPKPLNVLTQTQPIMMAENRLIGQATIQNKGVCKPLDRTNSKPLFLLRL
jgi:hypothetical protein